MGDKHKQPELPKPEPNKGSAGKPEPKPEPEPNKGSAVLVEDPPHPETTAITPANLPPAQTVPMQPFASAADPAADMRAIVALLRDEDALGIPIPAGLLAALAMRAPPPYVLPLAGPPIMGGPGNQGSAASHYLGHAGTGLDRVSVPRSLAFGSAGEPL